MPVRQPRSRASRPLLAAATVSIALTTVPGLAYGATVPTITGLSDRNSGNGSTVDIHGRFDDAVLTVDFGGTASPNFTKLSKYTVRAEIPNLPAAENVRIRVVTAGGETADGRRDDFDFLGRPPAEQLITVENTCVATTPSTPSPMRILTQQRAVVPASLRQGDPLTVSLLTTVKFPAAALEPMTRGGLVTTFYALLVSPHFGATGTSIGDVTPYAGFQLDNAFPGPRAGGDFAFDGPRMPVDFGTVTAAAGSTVVIKPGAFRIHGQFNDDNPFDLISNAGTFEYACTPDDTTTPGGGAFAAIPVVDDATPTPTATPEPTPTPTVTPEPTPTPTASPEPTVAPTPTPTPTVTPSPSPEPTPVFEDVIPYSYALAGSATLKTLTKGSLPLSGSIDAKLALPSGNFTGDLTLAPASGKLTALGFLPVDAKVNLVPTDQVRGTLKSGKLTAVAKVRIKLPSVKALGIELAGGANCQAKQVSSITLNSTQPTFMPLTGGPIAGAFSISDLSGCGFLTGIVSPLTSGAGNAIALNLSKK